MDEPAAPDADADAGAGAPTCYRHPGRETYLSCVRCGRPSCPDCLRSAPVGQQCVECVHEGNRGVRTPKAVFGGSLVSGATATWVLVGLNVVVYLGEWVYPKIVNYLDMVGASYDPTLHQNVGVADGQAYRLITSAFVHEPGLTGYGPVDIIFNMWALIIVGPSIEHMLGRLRYLAVYLISGIGGSVAFYFLAPANEAALGASGAIFGLFGAWFVLSRRQGLSSRGVVMVIGLNLVLDFVFPGIAWQAHVGGLLAGCLLTAAYVYAPRQNRALVQGAATVALLATAVICVVVRDYQLVGSVQF
jgi:membrane associated rhomboid family serine protease